MQEISPLASGYMKQSLPGKVNTAGAGEISFLQSARTVAASQLAVVERGNLAELALRRKQEVYYQGIGTEEEVEDIFSLIAKAQELLQKTKET